jgi:YgiT-type zinc finger domain-containing protein
MSDEAMYLCPQCQIGHLQPGNQTFVHVYDGLFVSMPDMPCYLCDVCGYQEYEPAAVAHVEALIGAARPGRSVARAAAKPSASEGSSRTLKR